MQLPALLWCTAFSAVYRVKSVQIGKWADVDDRELVQEQISCRMSKNNNEKPPAHLPAWKGG